MIFTVIMAVILAALSQNWRYAAEGTLLPSVSTALLTAAPPAAALASLLYFAAKKKRLSGESDSYVFEAAALSARYHNVARGVEFLVLAAYGAALAVGWRALPGRLAIERWALPTGAVLIAPFLASLVATWAALHYADTTLRGVGPTLRERLSFKLRHNVLTVFVPVAVVLAVSDAFELLPPAFKAPLEKPWVGALITAALVISGYAAAPIVIVRLWKTTRLGECSLRERLNELCRRIGVGFRDIRVWETPGHFFVNAAVMGLAGRLRYIIVSRSLIEAMPADEVEAVFAHELGHAKRHHMPYYLLLAADFLLLAYLFETATGVAIETGTGYLIVWTAIFALYWGGGFGYISRAFERDADLFGAETTGSYETFSRALRRIAHMNGIAPSARSWRHGSINSRVEFLHEAERSTQVKRRFLKQITFIRVLLATTAVVAATAIVVLQIIRS